MKKLMVLVILGVICFNVLCDMFDKASDNVKERAKARHELISNV